MATTKEYTELESEMQANVLKELADNWHSKSDLQMKLNIFNCSKVLYELLDMLGDNYVLVSRDMHGYINFGKGDCKKYEFESYKVMPIEEARELPYGYIGGKKDLNYSPNKKPSQTYAVPIDEPLPPKGEVFEDYNYYNEQENKRNVYVHTNYSNNSYNSYNSRASYSGRGRFNTEQDELDYHTDAFLDSMLDIEDVIDDSFLY